jgi:hypothetical protein
VNVFRQQRRTAAAAVVAIVAVLTVSYAYFFQAGGWNQNGRFALVRSIVEHGTLRVDDTAVHGGRRITGDIALHDGHLYCDKAPGASLTAVPAVYVARALVGDPSSAQGVAMLAWIATLVTAAVPTALTAALVFLLATRSGFDTAAAAFAALTFGLATPAWAYATFLFGHALASACLFAAFASAIALANDDDGSRDARLALAVGLGGGWASVTEYPSAIPAAVIALYAVAAVRHASFARRMRVLAFVAIGALACVAVLACYNTAAFGSPLTLGYAHEAGGFAGMKRGFMGVTVPKAHVLVAILFGPYRGLFYHAPVLALAPVGLVLLLLRRTTREPAIVATGIVAYYLLLNSAYVYWDGGGSYGPRHIAAALPFLALGLAALWSRANKSLRAVLVTLALGSAFMTLVAVSTNPQEPRRFPSPWLELNWPSFRKGALAGNLQSFVEYQPVTRRDPVAHSWNAGHRIGLNGLPSLLPLLAAWMAIATGWWVLQRPEKKSRQTR